MLGLQQQITNELKSPDDDITVKGRALFEYLYLNYEKKSKKQKNKSSIIESVCGPDSKNCGKDSMMSLIYFKGLEAYDQSELPTVFDHYFRHLYRIVKYIDDPQHKFFKKKSVIIMPRIYGEPYPNMNWYGCIIIVLPGRENKNLNPLLRNMLCSKI